MAGTTGFGLVRLPGSFRHSTGKRKLPGQDSAPSFAPLLRFAKQSLWGSLRSATRPQRLASPSEASGVPFSSSPGGKAHARNIRSWWKRKMSSPKPTLIKTSWRMSSPS
jgi:hypothetical protein